MRTGTTTTVRVLFVFVLLENMGFYKNVGAVPVLIQMKRTFYPVGQGGMYSECFWKKENQLSVVYDCGSTTIGKNTLVGFLKNDISDNDTVLIFVSHFHFDHINGIYSLLQDKKLNARLVIPKVSPEQLLIDFFYNFSVTQSFNNDANLFIRDYVIKGSDNREVDCELIEQNKPSVRKVLTDGNTPIWQYDIWNNERPYDSRLYNDLCEIIRKEFQDCSGYSQEIPDYNKLELLIDYFITKAIDKKCIKDFFDTIKSIFAKYPDGHNSYSLVVFSHSVTENDNSKYDTKNCLYTGDVPVDDTLLTRLKAQSIDYIQIPHHGSDKNNGVSLIVDDRIPFLSFGKRNRYDHPGKTVLKALVKSVRGPYFVTEYLASKVSLNYVVGVDTINSNLTIL